MTQRRLYVNEIYCRSISAAAKLLGIDYKRVQGALDRLYPWGEKPIERGIRQWH
jgi:hypothetical protein